MKSQIVITLLVVCMLGLLLKTVSADINVEDADAEWNTELMDETSFPQGKNLTQLFTVNTHAEINQNLVDVEIPALKKEIKTIFTVNTYAEINQNLVDVEIPTVPRPITEIFTVNEEAKFYHGLEKVEIPTIPRPITEIFIHLEEAILEKTLIFPKGLLNDTTQPFFTNIIITDITDTSAVIKWNTNEIADSLVKYGTTTGTYPNEQYDPLFVVNHTIYLNGLSPCTTYFFVVNSADRDNNFNESNQSSFTTTDSLQPQIDTVLTHPDSQKLGKIVNITCEITDNTEVSIAKVNLSSPSGVLSEYDMIKIPETHIYYYNSAYYETGSYTYFISACDTCGNWNISKEFIFTIISGDDEPPHIDVSVSLPLIPEDTDEVPMACLSDDSMAELTNITANVTDESDISTVIIDLTSLGSPIPMNHIPGTDIWYIEIEANVGSSIWDSISKTYAPHLLTVNASDEYGNWNTSVAELTVWLNGDVNGDGTITLYDATYLAKWYFNQPGFEYLPVNVADVSGDCMVTLFDATYLAKWYFNQPGFEVLH